MITDQKVKGMGPQRAARHRRSLMAKYRARDRVAAAAQPRDAFAEGFNARAQGRERTSNPFRSAKRRAEFGAGYTCAEREAAGD